MNNYCRLVIVLCLISSSTFAQDYYSGKKYVGTDVCFKVDVNSSGTVCLTDTTGYKGLLETSPVWLQSGDPYNEHNGNWTTSLSYQTLEIICHQVFSQTEINQILNCKNQLSFEVAIDPVTGWTEELRFLLHNYPILKDPSLLSIPVSKFELLAHLMKQNLVWEINSDCVGVSHLRSGGPLLQSWFAGPCQCVH